MELEGNLDSSGERIIDAVLGMLLPLGQHIDLRPFLLSRKVTKCKLWLHLYGRLDFSVSELVWLPDRAFLVLKQAVEP